MSYVGPKLYWFNIDDGNLLTDHLIDAAGNSAASIFDLNEYAWILWLHNRYGCKFVIQMWWQNNRGRTLAQVPTDRWKAEFEANSDWFHLSFHSWSQSGSYPDASEGISNQYITPRTTQFADYVMAATEMRRFAGSAFSPQFSVTHFWVGIKSEMRRIFEYEGGNVIWSTTAADNYRYGLDYDNCYHKNLHPEVRADIRSKGYYYDPVEKWLLLRTFTYPDVGVTEGYTFATQMNMNYPEGDPVFPAATHRDVCYILSHEYQLGQAGIKKWFEDAAAWFVANGYLPQFPTSNELLLNYGLLFLFQQVSLSTAEPETITATAETSGVSQAHAVQVLVGEVWEDLSATWSVTGGVYTATVDRGQLPDGIIPLRFKMTGTSEDFTSDTMVFDARRPVVTPSVAAGDYALPQTISLSTSVPARVHYTVNGSVPTRLSPVYTDPVVISDGAVTLRYLAITNTGTEGVAGSATYTIVPTTVSIDTSVPKTVNDFFVVHGVCGKFTTYVTLYLNNEVWGDAQITNGTWECSLTGLSQGVNYIVASAASEAGIVNTPTYELVSWPEPVLTIGYLPSEVSGTRLVVSGSCKYADAVQVLVDAPAIGGVCVPAGSGEVKNWSKEVINLPVGSNTLTVVAANQYWAVSESRVLTASIVRFQPQPVLGVSKFGQTLDLPMYYIDLQPPATVASVSGGLYRTSQVVTLMSLDNKDVSTIHYTVDGTEPTLSSPVYGVPLIIAAPTVLKFFGVDLGGNRESTHTEVYVIDAVPPQVQETLPRQAAQNQPLSTIIQVIFSEPLDATTLTEDTFSISPPIEVVVDYDVLTRTATMTPAQLLPADTEFTLTLSVGIADVAGNPFSTGYSWRFKTLDTKAPTGTMLINAGVSATSNRNVVLSVQVVDEVGVWQSRFRDAGGLWGSWESYSPSRKWLLPFGDGIKTVEAQFRDVAGNISALISDSILIDTSSPTALLSGLPVESSYSPNLTVTVSGTNVTAYRWRLDSKPFSAIIPIAQKINLWNLTVGSHRLEVYAQNYLGTWQVTPTTGIWTRTDNAPITTPSHGTSVYNRAINVTLSCNVLGVTYYSTDDGYPNRVYTGPIFIDETCTLKFFTVPLEEGPTESIKSEVYTMDLTPPIIAIISPAPGDTAVNNPQLLYTVSDGTVQVKVDGKVVSKVSGQTLDALAAGTHTISVESTDDAGNLGVSSTTFNVLDDTPFATLTGLPSSPTKVNSGIIAVGGLNVATYKYKLDSGVLSGVLPLATAITLNGLTNGVHVLEVYGINASGEQQGRATTFTWVVDTEAPVVEIISPVSGNIYTNTPLLSYNVSHGEVEVFLNAIPISKVSGQTMDLLANVQHTLTVKATDTAGNTGIANCTFTVNPAIGINVTFTAASLTTRTIQPQLLTKHPSEVLGVACDFKNCLPKGETLKACSVVASSGNVVTAQQYLGTCVIAQLSGGAHNDTIKVSFKGTSMTNAVLEADLLLTIKEVE